MSESYSYEGEIVFQITFFDYLTNSKIQIYKYMYNLILY